MSSEIGDMRAEVATWIALAAERVNQLDAVAATWGEHETDLDEAQQIREAVHALKAQLGQIEGLVESRMARMMTKGTIRTDRWKFERHGGNERINWQHDVLAGRLLDRANEAAGGDTAQSMWLFRDYMVQAASITWRVTALRTIGVDFNDLHEVVPKKRTVQATRINPDDNGMSDSDEA